MILSIMNEHVEVLRFKPIKSTYYLNGSNIDRSVLEWNGKEWTRYDHTSGVRWWGPLELNYDDIKHLREIFEPIARKLGVDINDIEDWKHANILQLIKLAGGRKQQESYKLIDDRVAIIDY